MKDADFLGCIPSQRKPTIPSYDAIAEFYDEDMGRNNPGRDIAFYCMYAATAPGPVLELGCGTGRITLPMVQRGATVHGLDASLPMLRELERKARQLLTGTERARLQLYWADMCDMELRERFALILCPFSAFNYVVDEPDRTRMLQNVRAHLDGNGLFILDTFIPHYEDLLLPDDHINFDYRRQTEDGMVLEREKTIHKDLTRQINIVNRTYRFWDAGAGLVRQLTTSERIRYYFFSELKLLLEHHGFVVEREYGDFDGGSYDYRASTMAFVCRIK